ncbi:Copper-containing nitrite reductase [uncultured Candidatus Thioglobus sp.]|nr:Copper-containing nitrite reductase [uncultured Candidatus Thioglobus sp.]
MKKIHLLFIGLLLPFFAFAYNGGGLEGYEVGVKADVNKLKKITQKLVAPPFLPEHDQIATKKAKIIQIKMVIEEKEIEVEPGVFIWAFTYNGSVPGPIIVAHEGDYIELTLINPKTNLITT